MFRKGDSDTTPELPKSITRPEPVSTSPASVAAPSSKGSVIGASLHWKGEISGAEDLSISGFVEGSIQLKQNTVTIQQAGRVQADIHAKIIHVEGEVTGDLFAGEVVIVHKSGQVKGNIKAPRVSLEEGARLKGAIDTDNAVGTEMKSTDVMPRNDAPNSKRQEATPAKPSTASAPLQ